MKILITGGAGFIGANCATYFANKGHKVVLFDNLSRIGSDKNLQWIKNVCSVEFVKGDVRKFEDLIDLVTQKGPFDLILHMGKQL